MNRFWKYQVRYRIARAFVHLGLHMMPPGRAKNEIMLLLWTWRAGVDATLAAVTQAGQGSQTVSETVHQGTPKV